MIGAMPPDDVSRPSLRSRQQELIRRERQRLPIAREALAGVLVDTARQLLKIRRMPVLLDAHEDVANLAAERGCHKHEEEGQTIRDLFRWQFALIVEGAAIDAARHAKGLPIPLSAFEREDAPNPVVERLRATDADLAGQVDARELLRSALSSYSKLEEFLATAPERVRLISTYAMEGRKRREIAELVSAATGERITPDNVRAIIHRQLVGGFPLLRFLWDNNQPTGGDIAAQRRRASARAAIEEAFLAHLARASPLVREIATVRHALGPLRSDWVAVATSVQQARGRVITSTEAKLAWERFVASLPPHARGADR